MVGYIILGIVVLFLAVILVRTLMFMPKKETKEIGEAVTLNEEKIVKDMVDMIRCKTVSNRDEGFVDWAEFEKFEALIKERFPKIFEAANFEKEDFYSPSKVRKVKNHLFVWHTMM